MLRDANWQRAGKKSGRPKPSSPLSQKKPGSQIGKTNLPPEEVKRMLAEIGPPSEGGS